MRESSRYDKSQLSGRNRRLLYEWQQLEQRLEGRHDITCEVIRRNTAGMPTAYLINYQLKSICGVTDMENFGEPGAVNKPQYATGYKMRIDLPEGYPSVDAQPAFRFMIQDEKGQPIPHPWHPNIRLCRACVHQHGRHLYRPDLGCRTGGSVSAIRPLSCGVRTSLS